MVVVERLEDIIAEERQLEDELRRLSLNSLKVETGLVAPQPPDDRAPPQKPTGGKSVLKTVKILQGLHPINTLPASFTDIRTAAFRKSVGE